MIKKIIFYIILLIPAFGYSQKFRIGIGLSDEEVFNNTQLFFGDLTIFEGNQKSFDPILLPYLGYELPLSKSFSAQFGMQYSRSGLSLVVNKPVLGVPNLTETGKIRSVISRNLEFPVELTFNILQTNLIKWKLRGGLVPIWSSSHSYQMSEVPVGQDWSQEVVDALNAAETIPKSFYLNYQYGIAMEYKRLEICVFYSTSLTPSISEGYTLYDTTYLFDRRINSTRLVMVYSFRSKKERR